MGYKMKKFSGFGSKKSPTKETQGFSSDEALIGAQKALSAEEMSYKAPGWARMATSILPGHDPTGQGKGRKGKAEDASQGAGGGIKGATKEVQGAKQTVKDMKELAGEFKGSGNTAKLASSDIQVSDGDKYAGTRFDKPKIEGLKLY